MPVVLLYGLQDATRPDRVDLKHDLLSSVVGIEELGLCQSDVTIFMVETFDLVTRGDVVVIVEGLFDRPERTEAIRKELASALATTVTDCADDKGLLWIHRIEVFVKRFDPTRDGFQVVNRIFKG